MTAYLNIKTIYVQYVRNLGENAFYLISLIMWQQNLFLWIPVHINMLTKNSEIFQGAISCISYKVIKQLF